jgi:hypothetical protein
MDWRLCHSTCASPPLHLRPTLQRYLQPRRARRSGRRSRTGRQTCSFPPRKPGASSAPPRTTACRPGRASASWPSRRSHPRVVVAYVGRGSKRCVSRRLIRFGALSDGLRTAHFLRSVRRLVAAADLRATSRDCESQGIGLLAVGALRPAQVVARHRWSVIARNRGVFGEERADRLMGGLRQLHLRDVPAVQLQVTSLG